MNHMHESNYDTITCTLESGVCIIYSDNLYPIPVIQSIFNYANCNVFKPFVKKLTDKYDV